ncbi:hypothetical protein R3W88_029568 [Solanum pinnatisectum]|uniref:Uncharacterized protein n=1 Tax=Solanum pinnatisectum TaxID=50273 RepID=A0AAV9K6U7_9SOLN|nr:hypothetical protein R3W88_029568 [Solanum pinnatisectum]
MIQIAFKPLTLKGLPKTFLAALRDARNLNFKQSLMGSIESTVAYGPVYFNTQPNLQLSLTDANILDALTLNLFPMPRPPPPFPQRLVKKNEEGKYRRFITMLKQFSINVPLIEALEQMPGYAKFMKDLVTKKRVFSFEDDDRLQHCSAIATRSLVQKKEDPGAFTIPCTIGLLHFAKALCDLGASINLMPLSIYKKLGLRDPKPTAMRYSWPIEL